MTIRYNRSISNQEALAASDAGGSNFSLAKFKRAAAKQRTKVMTPVETLIQKHILTLNRKYREASVTSDYGKAVFDSARWEKEREIFIKAVLSDSVEPRWLEWFQEDIFASIDRAASTPQNAVKSAALPKNPYEFEEHCAGLLNDAGWEAAVTKRAGDQGIDVVARKKSVVVVIQCKLYSRPIGNSAVQEAISGREFMRAMHAVVVSNASYTRSAKQLAATTGVLLLHVDDLPALDSHIKLAKD